LLISHRFDVRVAPVQLSRLAQVRAERGLSVEELARRARLSAATIYRLEAGNPARITTAVKLGDALGIGWRALVADWSDGGDQGDGDAALAEVDLFA
jgi:transcriptional regulator with XRE-family HTH domain